MTPPDILYFPASWVAGEIFERINMEVTRAIPVVLFPSGTTVREHPVLFCFSG